MTEEKFTQGEWDILDCRENPGADYDYSIVDSDGWCIAHIENCGLEEQEANAYLIAAAPEMYWMLEEAKRDFEALQINPNVSKEIKASAWLAMHHIERTQKKARGEE